MVFWVAVSILAACASGVANAADIVVEEAAPVSAGLPAVSGINGKLDVGKLQFDFDEDRFDNGGVYGIGTLTVPLSQSFGLQIDAGVLQMHDDAHQAGVGGHLFWRDPAQGLLGVYGEYTNISGEDYAADTASIALEAEAYMGQLSLEGLAGIDHVAGRNMQNEGTSGRFEGRIAWYATDDFRLEFGGGHRFDDSYLTAGLEASLSSVASNVSLYASADFSSDTTTARAGMRVYIGPMSKSLKARHREDDPQTFLFSGSPAPSGSPPATQEMQCVEGQVRINGMCERIASCDEFSKYNKDTNKCDPMNI